MYRIAVVDDVPTQCDALANAIDSICAARNDGYDVEISRFNTIADFEQALLSLREQDDTFDIVFMDIVFGDSTVDSDTSSASIADHNEADADKTGNSETGNTTHHENGIEAVARLFGTRPQDEQNDQDNQDDQDALELPTQVVYVTGHAEYCTKVYDTDHVSFLLKPVGRTELRAALKKAIDRCETYRSNPIRVHMGKMEYVVWPQHIQYMERTARTLLIHYDDGRVLRSYLKLRSLEPMMPNYLIRCHASYMVNLYAVAAFAGTDFVMCDGVRIPISQRRRHKTVLSFERFTRSAR